MSDININIKIPAVEKLMDVTKSGFGAVMGPLLIVGNALAKAKADKIQAEGEAEAIKTVAQAKAYSTKIVAQSQVEVKNHLLQEQSDSSTTQKTEIEMDTTNLIKTKIQFQERKRLNNIQNIVTQAKNKLPEQVSSKPVDPDWTARFFQNAQDISKEEMQQIWSSILAGEVETPGRTSLRTLDILKNITKKDAEIFNTVMKYRVNFFIFANIKDIDIDISSNTIFLLEELGLIQSGGVINIEKVPHILGVYGNRLLRLCTESENIENLKKDLILVYQLTQPAKELSSFLNHSTDFEYLKFLAQFFKQKNCQLQAAKIIGIKGKHFGYDLGEFKPVDP